MPLIVGFAKALDLAQADPLERDRENLRQAGLRDRLLDSLCRIPGARITGDRRHRLPNSASLVFEGVEGGDLVAALDLEGIAASTGSACTSGNVDPSHVLLAMGIGEQLAHGSLRLSLGRGTTDAEIDETIAIVTRVVERLRRYAPQLAEVS